MKALFGTKTTAIQKVMFTAFILVSLVQCGSKSSPVQQDIAVFFESKNKQYKAKVVFEGKIKALEPLSGELHVESSNGAPITSLVVETFVPTMPSMGHGTDNSRLSFEPNSQSPNTVKIKGIWFNMGGPWEIAVGAKVNGTSDTVLIKVEVP